MRTGIVIVHKGVRDRRSNQVVCLGTFADTARTRAWVEMYDVVYTKTPPKDTARTRAWVEISRIL